MFREAIIGQYYAANSLIHRLDPRIKIIGSFIFFISLFLYQDYRGYIFITFVLSIVVRATKVPLRYILSCVKFVIMLIIVTMVFNLLFREGEAIFAYKQITITKEGVYAAFFSGGRLLNLVVGASLLTLTTMPTGIASGLEYLIAPLARLGVPVGTISIMLSIVLRFIPILFDEFHNIVKAQTVRGGNYESKNIKKRLKALAQTMLPLFVSAFRKSNELATAMESKGFQIKAIRSKMKPLYFLKVDYAALLCILLYLMIVIYL